LAAKLALKAAEEDRDSYKERTTENRDSLKEICAPEQMPKVLMAAGQQNQRKKEAELLRVHSVVCLSTF
jgi:hypothetical protein